MKVIPLYLPQFHTIPENDEWWGKGFTEWVNVKSAEPLFEGHNQPRVPLNDYYYDLSDVDTLRWQCKIAREHGIYGFAMYHYWFNGHKLLEKPMEMLRDTPDIDINYMISWANHDWNDSWKATAGNVRTLIAHDFDDEKDWVNHFNYMLSFFKDPRYIKEDGMPLLIIYVPQLIGKLTRMLDLWTKMAKDEGFPGIKYIYQSVTACMDKSWDRSRFSYGIQFHPGYVQYMTGKSWKRWWFTFVVKYSRKVKGFFGINRGLSIHHQDNVKIVDYDSDWEKVLSLKPENASMLPSAMVDWDNTPRKKTSGWCYKGQTPEKFKKYFKKLLVKARKEYKTDKIFVFAWNEWAEGGYLEPDKRNGFENLEAIKGALQETGELDS